MKNNTSSSQDGSSSSSQDAAADDKWGEVLSVNHTLSSLYIKQFEVRAVYRSCYLQLLQSCLSVVGALTAHQGWQQLGVQSCTRLG